MPQGATRQNWQFRAARSPRTPDPKSAPDSAIGSLRWDGLRRARPASRPAGTHPELRFLAHGHGPGLAIVCHGVSAARELEAVLSPGQYRWMSCPQRLISSRYRATILDHRLFP